MKRYISARQYNLDAAFSEDSFTRAKYAEHTKNSELQEIYMYDPSWIVRSSLADNPDISKDVMKVLATDDYLQVLFCLLENPNITSDTLDIMADSTNIAVHAEMLSHCVKLISTDTLIKMYKKLPTDLSSIHRFDLKKYVTNLKTTLRRRGVNYEEIH